MPCRKDGVISLVEYVIDAAIHNLGSSQLVLLSQTMTRSGIPAALLVLADIGVLFSGVFARFILHRPLVWSDELASMLFLWLAMLGSVVALRRGEHMRMTAWVSKASSSRAALLEAFATSACLAFLAMVAWPAWEYASEEAFITTPALEISNAWRAAALPTGIV